MVWTQVASGSLVSGGWTGPTLLQAIKTAFNSAYGLTHHDEVLSASSTDSLIYRIVSDAGKTYGTAFVRFAVNYASTPVFRVSAMTAFNTS